MDSDRWKQVDSLLQAVLERPSGERDAFLARACAGDESLEREVRSLLASQQAAGSFLEMPAMEVAAQAMAAGPLESGQVLAGQTISHYRVLEKLGAGGMGVVWKARDTRLDRFAALKVLPAATMSDPERRRRFVQEAKTASALNHPNIITIYEIDQDDGADFIAMEFVPGKTLDQLITRKGLRLNHALHYAIQVADALAAAHAAGIVHRDLKPGNVMVNENESVKVLDFGLAKLAEGGVRELARTQTIGEPPQTQEGTIVGTVSYMSPEQAEGKKLDSRTDIFSFGAVLYEMITGTRAFGGESRLSILSAILRDEPKPAREIVAIVPLELDRIVTRCLQKDPNRRYQHAGDLKIDLQRVNDELAAGGAAVREVKPRKRRTAAWWWLGAAAAVIGVGLTAAWWVRRTAPPPLAGKLTRITNDAGLSRDPALSPDGKLVAYSADGSLDGKRDLYVKQVAGGQPIRLTSDGALNMMPDFSPDGARIVFRSGRGGGGIYEIPAFGGEARLLARDGWHPKYSPDGSEVAYWVGSENVSVSVPGSGSIWVVPVAGGQSRRVGANFTGARYPVWSPDGKHLLFMGYTSAKAYESSSLDWWLVPTNGGDAVKTNAYDVLVGARLRIREFANVSGPRPTCWSGVDNTVIFSAATGDTQNLWEMVISPQTGKASGLLKRLTTGGGNEQDPSCAAGGALAFANVESTADVWSLPVDLDRGVPKGDLERITEGPARREYVSISRDGHHAAFASATQSSTLNIWVRDMATGKESKLASSSFPQNYPVISPSGGRVAFSSFEKEKRLVYVAAPGGPPEKLCEGCLRATDWSRDEKSLLVFLGNPYQINVLDVASQHQTPLLKHAAYHLLYGRFSPDNRWVSFTARISPNRGRIVIAPTDGPKPVPESAWITIEDGRIDEWAEWSPDGRTLYFSSLRDGHACLWGQRMDAISHRPSGEPFEVLHLHGRLRYMGRGLAAGGGHIAMVLVEARGSIWLMSRPGGR